jgi:hypothetical protein
MPQAPVIVGTDVPRVVHRGSNCPDECLASADRDSLDARPDAELRGSLEHGFQSCFITALRVL